MQYVKITFELQNRQSILAFNTKKKYITAAVENIKAVKHSFCVLCDMLQNLAPMKVQFIGNEVFNINQYSFRIYFC